VKLLRIEAGRFGKIDGRTLGDLSPQLTVVHGPNEAGKSSFTALVRHVLYGFPTPADIREAPYLSPAGKREGRLVFADGQREWVIERTEGAHGGPVTARALDGTHSDGLVAALTSGVSRLAYRVVLGFGLADLAQLEELKGQDDDLLARLYAAGAGLKVSPIDVRKVLSTSMDELWKKGGSAPVLNKAKSEREAARSRIRLLEAESEQLRAEAARLEIAAAELESARTLRTETQAEAERIARAIGEAERLREAAAEATGESERLAREAAAARDEAASLPHDADALAAAGEVEAIAEELSGFRAQIEALASQQARLDVLDGRIRTAVGDTGWTVEQALAAASDAGVAAEIESFRDRVNKARARAEVATTNRDAARAADASADTAAAPSGRGWLVPGAIVAAIGALAVVAGLVASQTLLAAFGGLLVVAGAVLAFAGPRGTSAPSRLVAGPRASAAEQEVVAAEAALSDVLVAWGRYVRARGLGEESDDPAGVAARYQAARSLRSLDGERFELTAAIARAREAADTYAARARVTCATLLGDAPDAVTLERVAEVVNRARARVSAARAAAATTAETVARAEALSRAAADAAKRGEGAAQRAESALVEAGVAGGLDAARVAEVEARSAAADASRAFEQLAEEVARLSERLGSERRDTELAELRLSEETIGERIAAGMREYAVLAMAARLLSEAQERYERDRQPEVVKHAESAFVRMTNGRYSRIAVPLGKDAIEVFDRSGASVTPGKLSRGTAEQLYLALRIGLIDQLGEAGASLPVLMDDVLVNFSPERVEPAARSIVDLAERRQVIFFTCHPAMADLLCRIAPDAVRIDIDQPA